MMLYLVFKMVATPKAGQKQLVYTTNNIASATRTLHAVVRSKPPTGDVEYKKP